MLVRWLSLADFRSYGRLDWEPDPGTNLLIGHNAAGKTNLLEALAYLGTLQSLRGVPDKALVREGAGAAVVRAEIAAGDSARLVEVEIPERGAKRAQLDKSRLGRVSELLGVVRVVAFLPEDLDVVKRGPAQRRALLDDVAVQLWPAAHLDQSEFERALRQRNAFLKAGVQDAATLGVWDARLAQAGGRVLARRARVIAELEGFLEEAYDSVAGTSSGAVMTYETSWGHRLSADQSASELAAALSEGLETRRRVDYERRMTTVGPHRDDPGFELGGLPARTHASQGEQRTLALAFRLASHAAMRHGIGQDPLLLLDDVFSELDPDRSRALAKALPSGVQTLITSARPEDVPLAGRTWEVGGGGVR